MNPKNMKQRTWKDDMAQAMALIAQAKKKASKVVMANVAQSMIKKQLQDVDN
jgi:hypothetical protein